MSHLQVSRTHVEVSMSKTVGNFYKNLFDTNREYPGSTIYLNRQKNVSKKCSSQILGCFWR